MEGCLVTSSMMSYRQGSKTYPRKQPLSREAKAGTWARRVPREGASLSTGLAVPGVDTTTNRAARAPRWGGWGAPSPRPLVHTDDLRSGSHRCWGRLHQSQAGVGTGLPLETDRQPDACLVPEGQAQGAQVLGEPQRPSRPRRHHGGHAFRKNLAWTCSLTMSH
jgi:hypothetical protein